MHTDVHVVMTRDPQVADSWIRSNVYGTTPAACVGLDAEWPSHGDPTPTLLQVTAEPGLRTLLLRLPVSGDRISDSRHLSRLMSDPDVVKSGADVMNDVVLLRRHHPGMFGEFRGWHDVGLGVARVKAIEEFEERFEGKTCDAYLKEGGGAGDLDGEDLWNLLRRNDRVGLKRCYEYATGREMEKSSAVQRSNWAARKLSDRQIAYAAMDSVASAVVHRGLVEKGVSLRGGKGGGVEVRGEGITRHTHKGGGGR